MDHYKTEKNISTLESDGILKDEIYTQKLRKDYISKVLNIVAAQLAATFAFTYIANEVSWMSDILKMRWTPLISTIVMLIPLILLGCGMSQKTPMNYILLAVFTLCMSVTTASHVLAYMASFGVNIIVSAIVSTSILIAVLSIYAKTTKRQFGDYMTYMFAGGIAIMVTSAIGFFVHSTVLQLCITGFSMMLCSFYFIYDVQRLLRGPIDDYILGALNLYLDIITLFFEMLRMFGLFKRSSS